MCLGEREVCLPHLLRRPYGPSVRYCFKEEKNTKNFKVCLKKCFTLSNLFLSMILSAEFEEPHNYEATISYLRHSGNSINLCTAEEIADCKSAKPIKIVALRRIKMCPKWYFSLQLTISL